ncbi:MAG: helix-turn-helix domain-containing protein [Candidatus Bathyarchaeota archaeon]|nr:helix-turn-helix domain-containing protein [Candidatus Bathyarchaeota archaeon]
MPGLEDFCDLLFEISNEDRLRIMEELGAAPLHATGVSRRLDIPTQEASRHLLRLAEVGLIAKSPDGLYSLTPYGALSLRLLEGERFASAHSDYFATHTAASVPRCFASRIGELSEATIVDDVMITLHNVERVIREAREYVVRMTDRYQLTAIPHIGDALERGVEFRAIEPLNIVRPPGYEPDPRLTEADGRWKNRAVEGLGVCLTASEREVAALCFPAPDGRFDYRGFSSKDPATHRWCMDLFEHYWGAGGRIRDD